jgi:ABC-type uncharacterized transport system substrate-binding protein
MTYGPNTSDQQREVGIYTGRILKGDQPTAHRPAGHASDQFEFVINLQTARLLGIEVPRTDRAINCNRSRRSAPCPVFSVIRSFEQAQDVC